MKQNKKYRAIVIGSGGIGALLEADPKRPKPATHAGAFMANKKTELVALVDTNSVNLLAASKLFPGIKCYSSADECFKNEKVDIVAIATGPTSNLSLVKACTSAGVKAIVCEKPIAASAVEAKQIQAIVEKTGVVLVLNYQRRFYKLFRKVHDRLMSGVAGRIQQVTCYYSNGLYNNGGHTVDALLYLLDDHIVSVVGLENEKNQTHPKYDKNIDALLVTERGTVISLQSFDQSKYGIHDFRIFGEKESLVLTDYGTTLIETPAHPSVFAGVNQLAIGRARTTQAYSSAVADALANAIDCLENKKKPVSGCMNGLETMKVLDSIMKSAVTKKPIKI